MPPAIPLNSDSMSFSLFYPSFPYSTAGLQPSNSVHQHLFSSVSPSLLPPSVYTKLTRSPLVSTKGLIRCTCTSPSDSLIRSDVLFSLLFHSPSLNNYRPPAIQLGPPPSLLLHHFSSPPLNRTSLPLSSLHLHRTHSLLSHSDCLIWPNVLLILSSLSPSVHNYRSSPT